MRRTVLTIAATLAFGLCALAQQKPANDPRSAPPGSDPATMPSQQAPEASSPAPQSAGDTKGQKKLKGCLQAQGSSYVLEDKKGRQVMLSGGQDLATHVGHTVVVHGSFASAASTGGNPSGSTTGASSAVNSNDQFTVSQVEMVSATCNTDKNKATHDKTPQ